MVEATNNQPGWGSIFFERETEDDVIRDQLTEGLPTQSYYNPSWGGQPMLHITRRHAEMEDRY